MVAWVLCAKKSVNYTNQPRHAQNALQLLTPVTKMVSTSKNYEKMDPAEIELASTMTTILLIPPSSILTGKTHLRRDLKGVEVWERSRSAGQRLHVLGAGELDRRRRLFRLFRLGALEDLVELGGARGQGRPVGDPVRGRGREWREGGGVRGGRGRGGSMQCWKREKRNKLRA